MSDSAGSRARVRLSVDVSPELNDLLDTLAEKTHSTKSDVLRRAIGLMDVAVEAREHGQKLYISEEPPFSTSRAGDSTGESHPALIKEIVGIY
jgi:predicted DNA-binding protein